LIEKKEIKKLVLARRTTFTCSTLLDPFEVLERLNSFSQRTTCFAFVQSKNRGFIGVSPEKLFERHHRLIFSEAVAGTRARGINLEEDLQLEQELKQSPKENREFHFVKNYIQSTLSPFCSSLNERTPETVIKTKNVQHLYQGFEGILHTHITDIDLICSLHPSPAVGGFPVKKALTFIKEKESFDRGWYAAPIGWSSQEKAEFAVGIRSALIDGNQLHVFAGTGIVEGSQPEKEWEELEMKISSFKNLFL
jgi:menaquinone-specific isochorismate synthase